MNAGTAFKIMHEGCLYEEGVVLEAYKSAWVDEFTRKSAKRKPWAWRLYNVIMIASELTREVIVATIGGASIVLFLLLAFMLHADADAWMNAAQRIHDGVSLEALATLWVACSTGFWGCYSFLRLVSNSYTARVHNLSLLPSRRALLLEMEWWSNWYWRYTAGVRVVIGGTRTINA